MRSCLPSDELFNLLRSEMIGRPSVDLVEVVKLTLATHLQLSARPFADVLFHLK